MPYVGVIAPDFTLPDQDGEPVTLSSFRGQNVVVYFYPRASTPGCTTQACGIRDHRADYAKANAVVLGVSPDPQEKLSKFAADERLDFTLLGDQSHEVAERYGVWVEKSRYGKKYMGMERSTFVIGPDGVITHIFRNVKPAEHDELVLGALGFSTGLAHRKP
jgi:thioredoxin-dependent peroxiredoxin